MGGGNFLVDFALGGVSGAVAKTITAPIERIKLVVQTQDANPKIRSGEVPRYTGIADCGMRIYKEQGMKRFWDGNFTNCIRYFPTQAFNLAFKDTFKRMFPKYNPKTEFAQFFGAFGVWWVSCGQQLVHRVPVRLRTNSLSLGCRFWQKELLWPGRLHREDHEGSRWIPGSLHRLRRLGGGHRRL